MNEKKDIFKEVQEELEEISPILGQMSSQHPYKVHPGYFEALSGKASQMAKDIGVQRGSVIRRLVTIRNVAAAASVIVIAMLVWVSNYNIANEDLAEVSVDEMIEYLEEESAFGIDEYDLVEELIDIESTVKDIEVQEKDMDVAPNDKITDEDIIKYLLEENIELGTIIEVLN